MSATVKLLLASITALITLLACNKGTGLSNAPAKAFWEKGNGFYARQKWDSAVNNYTKALKSGGDDAAVYYNLGNAEYKLGHTGQAVVNYRRALFYKPDYTVAAENLELAESRIPGRLQPPQPIFFVRWWDALTEAIYSGIWAIAALLLFTLAIILLWLRRRNKKTIRSQMIVALFILWAFSLTIAIAAAQKTESHNEAVVIHPKVMLKTEDGKQIISVPEGTLVTRNTVHDDRIEVILPDGRRGWLSAQDIEVVH